MTAYYFKGIKRSEAQGGLMMMMMMVNHRSDPTDAARPPKNARNGHPSEDPDGLDACRGFRNGVILEVLAIGLVTLLWKLTAWVAAWWRAW